MMRLTFGRWQSTLLAAVVAAAVLLGGCKQEQQAGSTAATGPVKKLKMQASWPASLTLYENFKQFAERLSVLTGGQIQIETLAAGAIVPAFEVLDATHKGVIDGAHTWAGYWVGKHKAAILFTGGPGGTFGMDYMDVLGWHFEGGGYQLYQEYYRDVLKLDVMPILILPSGPQAFGWFKKPVKSLADLKGMKCRETGLAAEIYQAMGMSVVNMPGGEITPAAERGTIDCAEWVGGVEDLRFGFQNIWKYHYTPGMHEPVTIGELLINGNVWRSFTPVQQEIIRAAAMETFTRWWVKWQKQNSDAYFELKDKHKVNMMKMPEDINTAFLKAWDKMAAAESATNPFFKKVLDSQRAYASVVVPAKRFMFPEYKFAANYYWPEKK